MQVISCWDGACSVFSCIYWLIRSCITSFSVGLRPHNPTSPSFFNFYGQGGNKPLAIYQRPQLPALLSVKFRRNERVNAVRRPRAQIIWHRVFNSRNKDYELRETQTGNTEKRAICCRLRRSPLSAQSMFVLLW